MIGPCAKTIVTCTIITKDGRRFVGQNSCRNPQPVCPRAPGDGYEKCNIICRQDAHAEIIALGNAIAAKRDTRDAHAYIEGHHRVCRECEDALWLRGIGGLTFGPPPPLPPPPRLPKWVSPILDRLCGPHGRLIGEDSPCA